MIFFTGTDNRYGNVEVDPGDGNTRRANYNVDPGSKFESMSRTLSASVRAGNNDIVATINTESRFKDVTGFECSGLFFKSKAEIKLPETPANGARVRLVERISMGIRINEPGAVRLVTSIRSNVDSAFVSLIGPASSIPLNDPDKQDQIIQLNQAGDYTLLGGSGLGVHLPNSSLGGLPLSVFMSAELTKG